MDSMLNPVYWLVVGFVLAIAEVIIPGGIVFFLGAGCLLVAGAIWIGWVSTWMGAMTLFFVSSLVLIVGLRTFTGRLVEGDSSKANTVEILDDIGETVSIVERVGPGNKVGRILYRGTQWEALGNGEVFTPGDEAKIVAQENVRYIIERIS